MANLIAIHDAIATSITRYTGLRADGQARDSIAPPCAVVLPGNPYITYGVTMDGPVMGGPAIGSALNFSFVVLLLMPDAAPVEKTQRALYALLGAGQSTDVTGSVPMAIERDNTLGGLVDFIQAVTAAPPGRIDYSGVTYLGARVNCIAGGM